MTARPWKVTGPNRKESSSNFQPPFFRDELLNFGRGSCQHSLAKILFMEEIRLTSWYGKYLHYLQVRYGKIWSLYLPGYHIHPPGGFSIAGISSINICQSARLCCFLAVYRGSEGFTKEEVESLKQLFDSEAVSWHLVWKWCEGRVNRKCWLLVELSFFRPDINNEVYRFQWMNASLEWYLVEFQVTVCMFTSYFEGASPAGKNLQNVWIDYGFQVKQLKMGHVRRAQRSQLDGPTLETLTCT